MCQSWSSLFIFSFCPSCEVKENDTCPLKKKNLPLQFSDFLNFSTSYLELEWTQVAAQFSVHRLKSVAKHNAILLLWHVQYYACVDVLLLRVQSAWFASPLRGKPLLFSLLFCDTSSVWQSAVLICCWAFSTWGQIYSSALRCCCVCSQWRTWRWGQPPCGLSTPDFWSRSALGRRIKPWRPGRRGSSRPWSS